LAESYVNLQYFVTILPVVAR